MSNGLFGPVALAVRRLLEKAGLVARDVEGRDGLAMAVEMLEQRLLLSDVGVARIGGAVVSAAKKAKGATAVLTPYKSKAGHAPGMLQVENYDYGGEGVAYHDVTDGNKGGLLRKGDSVDIGVVKDGGTGYGVMWTNAREWLKYTVDVAYTAKYDLAVRVASRGPGGTFHVEMDGVRVTKRLSVPDTGGPQRWVSVTTSGVPLNKGRHVLRLVMSSQGKGGYVGNFNWMAFALTPPRAPSDLAAVAKSESEIALAWRDNADNETGFLVERKPAGADAWEGIAEVGSNVTGFADEGLSAGTGYEYRVRAMGDLADSPYAGPVAATTMYSGPIVISSGGVYSGRWESLEAGVPAVSVQTSEPVVIESSVIRSQGDLIAADGYDVDLTVRGTRGYALNPNIAGRSPGRFLNVDGFVNVVVENNYMEGTTGIYLYSYAGDHSHGQTVKVVRNAARNIDGRASDGAGGFLSAGGSDHVQFFQIDGVQDLVGAELAWNQVINEPGQSLVEDVISIFSSSGTSESPFLIHDNYIQGAYAADPAHDAEYTGGGIMLSDVGSAYVWAYNNEVIGTSNYGIAISSGHDNQISSNRVLSSGKMADGTAIAAQNTGIYVWNQNEEVGFMGNGGFGNVVGWERGEERNDWWVPDATDWTDNTSWPGTIGLAEEAAEWDVWQGKLTAAGIVVGPDAG